MVENAANTMYVGQLVAYTDTKGLRRPALIRKIHHAHNVNLVVVRQNPAIPEHEGEVTTVVGVWHQSKVPNEGMGFFVEADWV